MAFHRIHQIVVGENPPGTIFGGFIYSFSVKMGNSTTPTSIDVSVINQSGIYSINRPQGSSSYGSLSSTNPIDIKIINSMGKIIYAINDCFLVNYNTSTSVGQQTLQLKFVDRSILLDKIQVSLLGENLSKYSFVNGNYIADIVTAEEQGVDISRVGARLPTPEQADLKKLSANVFYKCPACDPRRSNEAWVNEITRKYVSERGFISNIDPVKGGFLAIGTEEYSSTDCQLKNVTYNFDELKYALAQSGIIIEGVIDRSISNQTISNIKGEVVPYRAKHTGTLRDVLNSWCSDFGYTWVLDPILSNRYIGIDLSTPMSSLVNIEKIAKNLKEGSGLALESINHSFSIEDTSKQYHTSTFRRPAKVKTTTSNIHERQAFSNIRISELMPCALFGPRNEQELMISCALSKFNKEARTIFNWMICRGCNDLSPLGISLKYKLTQSEKESLLNLSYSNKEAFDKAKKYGANAEVWLGTYSQELENKWVDWESLIAEFIGRWYKITHVPSDTYICGKPQFEKTFKLSSTPSSEEYEEKNKHEFPFNDILKHPDGVKLKGQFPVRIFSRSSSYGTKDEDIEDIFKDSDGASVLQEVVPEIEFIDGATKANLGNLISTVFPDTVGSSFDAMKEHEKPALIFAPEMHILQNFLQVGELKYGMINPLEQANQDKKEEEKDKDCELQCEEDPIVSLCESMCEKHDPLYKAGRYSKDPPPQTDVKLASTRAWSFSIKTNSKALDAGAKKIIFPSMNDFYGYLTYHSELRQTVSGLKRTFGDIGNAGETMKLNLNSTDITSDVEALDGSNADAGISPPLIVVPHSNQVGSPEERLGTSHLINAEKYHEKTKIQVNNDLAKESIDLTLLGDFGHAVNHFGSFLSPQFGLTSFSIDVKDDGQVLNLSFSNKPADLPKQDLTLQKVTTTLNLNTFGRTF